MREEAFGLYLSSRLTPASASSTRSCARRVERLLAIDLDRLALDGPAVNDIGQRLLAEGLTHQVVSSCCAAVRRYADFRRGVIDPPKPPVRKASLSTHRRAPMP